MITTVQIMQLNDPLEEDSKKNQRDNVPGEGTFALMLIFFEEWKRSLTTGKDKSFETWKNWIEKCHLGRNCHPCRLVSPQKSPKMPILILSSAQFVSLRLSSILMSMNLKKIRCIFFRINYFLIFFNLDFSLGTCLCLTAHMALVTTPRISC